MNSSIDYIAFLTEELELGHDRAHLVLILTDAVFCGKFKRRLIKEWPVFSATYGPLYPTAAKASFQESYLRRRKFVDVKKLPSKERNILEFIARHTRNLGPSAFWKIIYAKNGGVGIPGHYVNLVDAFDEFKKQSPGAILFIEKLLLDYPPE